jgi:Tol biopolymer transport system component
MKRESRPERAACLCAINESHQFVVASSKVVSLSDEATLVRRALQRILASPEFAHSERMCRFLEFTVEEKLAGRGASLKETLIGVHVFDRRPGYDPKIDAIVRVEARRLRNKLLEYSHTHPAEGVYIELPKGSYVPEFRRAGVSSDIDAGSGPSTVRKSWLRAGGLVAAAALAAFLGVVALRHFKPFYTAMEGRPLTTYPGYQTGPSFSPDGRQVAFCWSGSGGGLDAVWVQAVDGDTPRRLTHSQALESRPVWSPNGQQLAFLREVNTGRRSIYVISVSAKEEKKVGEMTDNGTPGRIDWSPDGTSLITSEMKSPDGPSVVVRLSLRSGKAEQITAPPNGSPGDTEPAFSPDGRAIAFRRSTGVDVEDIYILSTPPPESHLPVSSSVLRRISFDNRAIRGFAWSADGRSLIVASCRGGSLHSLWRFPVSRGAPARLTEAGITTILPAVSRSGNRLAYVKVVADTNIWRVATAAGAPAKVLIASTLLDSSPQFSPDGTRIAFRSDRSGNNEVWTANADGSDQRQITHFNGPLTGSPRWSPDGAYLALESRDAGNADIFILPTEGGTLRRFTTNTANDILPSWSRDGKSIYFASDRSGKWQVWKQDVAGGEARQVTNGGGFMAFESFDARFVFFYRHDPEPAIWRLALATGEETPMVSLKWHEMWGNWAAGKRGLFFLDYNKAADPPIAAIKFLDLRRGTINELGSTSRKPTTWNTGLALSPDERWLLYSQVDGAGSNIMLAENFR